MKRHREAVVAERNAGGEPAASPILAIRGVQRTFTARSGEVVAALDNISLEVLPGNSWPLSASAVVGKRR